MDFEEFSKKTTSKINIEIEKLLSNWRKEVSKIDVSLLPLIDQFIAGSKGGKRLRGGLVVLGYELGKKSSVVSHQSSDKTKSLKADDPIFKIAAAYEIFHTAILAHDDVIDQSLLRRGQPSLYNALGKDHNGQSLAICLGDAGFFLAVKAISESNFKDTEKNQAITWFSKTMLCTAMGEILDIKRGDCTTIMKLKTADYSVSGPLILGAILGGAKKELIRKFGVFGENLGIAFQIQDDILGVFGAEKETGKSVTSDIEEKKNTIIFEYALKNSSKKQKSILKKLYGKSKIGILDAKIVKEIFTETGALEYAQKSAEGYKKQALKVLSGITKHTKMSKILEQLSQYLVERKK